MVCELAIFFQKFDADLPMGKVDANELVLLFFVRCAQDLFDLVGYYWSKPVYRF